MVPLFLGELGEPQGQEGPRALATKGPTEEVSPHRISTSHTTLFLEQSNTVGELGSQGPSWKGSHPNWSTGGTAGVGERGWETISPLG